MTVTNEANSNKTGSTGSTGFMGSPLHKCPVNPVNPVKKSISLCLNTNDLVIPVIRLIICWHYHFARTDIRTDSKSRVRGIELGADAFLSKPIDESELVSQVKAVLRIKNAEDHLRGERDRLEDALRERTRELQENGT